MKNTVSILKALSDPQRLRILKMLELRSLCVCEITAVLNLAISTVSKHLAILRQAGLIRDWKEGKWVNYKLNDHPVDSWTKTLWGMISSRLQNEPQVVKDQTAVQTVDRNSLCNR
ncbi:MAG: ArsR/SmtB family transcription factor [Fidelibacterota bacterium]